MLQVMLIYSSIKPSTVTSYRANLPFCSLLYFRWDQGKFAASQPRAAFAPRLVLLGHTHCHRHLCPEHKAGSLLLLEVCPTSRLPKTTLGKGNPPSLCHPPDLCCWSVQPALLSTSLSPLSIPFKLILLCRAQAKLTPKDQSQSFRLREVQ